MPRILSLLGLLSLLGTTFVAVPADAFMACQQYANPNEAFRFARCHARLSIRDPPPPGSPPEAYANWAVQELSRVCLSHHTPPEVHFNDACGPKEDYILVHEMP